MMTETFDVQLFPITSSHGKMMQVQAIYSRMAKFFHHLKNVAPQLTPQGCWERILAKAMEAFTVVMTTQQIKTLPAPDYSFEHMFGKNSARGFTCW